MKLDSPLGGIGERVVGEKAKRAHHMENFLHHLIKIIMPANLESSADHRAF